MCVVAALKKRMERGEDLLNTAILLRTNQESEGLINVLMEYQVPFTMKEQLPNLFRHWICRALLAYLEMAAGDRSRKKFSGDHEPAKSLYFQRSVEQFAD